MVAFIALFMPPIIVLIGIKNMALINFESKWNDFIYYIVSVLCLNFADILILGFVTGDTGNLVFKLNEYGNFAAKYMCMSIVLALGFTVVASWIKKNVTFDIKFKQKTLIGINWDMIFWLYLFIMLLINFIRIFDNNFWGDEAFSIKLSKMTYKDMVLATSTDVHPPLYYVFVILGYRICGEHGWMYHLMSFIPYFIMIIFAATVIKKRFGLKTSVIFITLASVLRNAMIYNVEVRMYSWAALFILFAFYELFCVIENDTILNSVLFAVFSLGAAYTHYYALLSVAFFNLFILVCVILKKIKIRTMLLTYIIIIVGYSPWLITLFNTLKRTSKSFWMSEYPGFKECFYFVFQSGRLEFPLLMWLVLGISLLLIFCYELGIFSISRSESKYVILLKGKERKISNLSIWMFFGILSIIGTIVVGEMASFIVRPVLLTRYIYPVSVVAWLVLAVCISKLTKKRILSLVIVFIILLANVPTYFVAYKDEKMENDNCKNTVAYMASRISEDDIILTNGSHLAWTILEYYTKAEYFLVSTGDLLELEDDTTYWIVWSEDIGSDVETWLSEYGLICKEIYHNGLLGSNSVHLYQLTKFN